MCDCMYVYVRMYVHVCAHVHQLFNSQLENKGICQKEVLVGSVPYLP